ncbi:hypothetical protein ACI65C_005977 [Semiaphis heraclei]
MAHSMSPNRSLSRDQSLSPRINMIRPPSPPSPYSPECVHYNSDNNMLSRDIPMYFPERNVHDRSPRPDHFLEQIQMDNISSGPPPEPRSPEPGDHNRHRSKDDLIHYDVRSRRSISPVYFDNHYRYNRSMSPDNRPFSPNHEQQLLTTTPSVREFYSPLRDRPPYPNERSRRRRTPPTRRDRSRERRRHISPRRRTPPPVRSYFKRKEYGKRRPNKNWVARKREAKERKRRSQSKEQQQQQNSFQQPQPQPIYPLPPPPPGVVRMPPRPFPSGPMMIPLRPPPFPPPMGAWRPPRPPMRAPSSGWPYPLAVATGVEHSRRPTPSALPRHHFAYGAPQSPTRAANNAASTSFALRVPFPYTLRLVVRLVRVRAWLVFAVIKTARRIVVSILVVTFAGVRRYDFRSQPIDCWASTSRLRRLRLSTDTTLCIVTSSASSNHRPAGICDRSLSVLRGCHIESDDYHTPFTSISNTVQLKKDAVLSIFNKNVIDNNFSCDENVQGNDHEVSIPSTSQARPSDHCVAYYDVSKSPDNNDLIDNDDSFITTPTSSKSHLLAEKKVFWGDFKTVDDIDTPNSRLKYWHASQNVITEQKKKRLHHYAK